MPNFLYQQNSLCYQRKKCIFLLQIRPTIFCQKYFRNRINTSMNSHFVAFHGVPLDRLGVQPGHLQHNHAAPLLHSSQTASLLRHIGQNYRPRRGTSSTATWHLSSAAVRQPVFWDTQGNILPQTELWKVVFVPSETI